MLTTGAGNMLESAATFNVVATNGTTVGADYAVPATITFNANSGNGDTTPDVPLTFNPTDDLLVEGSQSVTVDADGQRGGGNGDGGHAERGHDHGRGQCVGGLPGGDDDDRRE